MLFVPAEVAAVSWGWEGGKLVCIKWIKKWVNSGNQEFASVVHSMYVSHCRVFGTVRTKV